MWFTLHSILQVETKQNKLRIGDLYQRIPQNIWFELFIKEKAFNSIIHQINLDKHHANRVPTI